MKTILCLFAHPDDAEIWMGGTILKHLQLNYTIKVITFFGHSKIRLKEVKHSSEILGYEHITIDTMDYVQPDYRNVISKLENDIPDVIFTHWNKDTHIEHQHIYNLTENLVHFWKRYKKHTPITLMVSTYFMRGIDEVFIPDIVIDIEKYHLLKIEAISCHKSQKINHLLNDIESQHKIFGGQADIKLAEGFKEKIFFGKRKLLIRNEIL